MKSAEDCCEPTTGPQTCPLDLKSSEFGLRDQSSKTRDGSNPKEDAMLDMIDARVATKFDPTGGMKPDNEKSRSLQ